MRVLIDGCIRGEPVEVIWEDGVVSGDMELVRRARLMCLRGRRRYDEGDAASFISALEYASGERLEVSIWPSDEWSATDRRATIKAIKDLTK